MLTPKQEDELTDRIPEDTDAINRRAAYCVINGYKYGKSVQQMASYYSVDIEMINKWYKFFNFSSTSTPTTAKKRGRKSKDLKSYIVSNSGRTMSAKDAAKEIGVSLPTFYNFYKANSQYFVKTKRGEFTIVDPMSNSGDQS